MRRTLLLFLMIFVTTALSASAPKVWWIYFADKQGSVFDPYTFFDPAAIERREKNGISIYDISDYPVSPFYLQEVSKLVDTMGYASRWLNAVSVVASEEQIVRVQQLKFVTSVQLQFGFDWVPANVVKTIAGDPIPKFPPQITEMQGEQFGKHQITGRGINIAILDAGFWGVDSHEAFADLRFNNRITRTKNFLKGDSNIYVQKTDHGTSVLSCIAGKTSTQTLGVATEANFLLAIISKEYGNQYRAEEHYLAGVEWADQYGAHIINISGGPNENSYFAEQMDGKTTLISYACKIAARKGILVVAAAGNNGDKSERQLLPPAETDSVLSVTAMGDDGFIADYSAVGPPPDFRRKPDICAPGSVLTAAQDKKGNEYAYGDGTSFSAPLATGFAACLMQLFPEITAMGTIDSIRRCAHLYPYYDYAHGYGVPQAGYFFRTNPSGLEATFSFVRVDTGTKIEVAPSADSLSGKIQERLLFWNLTDSAGRIIQYNVIEVTTPDPVLVEFDLVAGERRGYKICVWYRGYYAETDF